MQLYSHKDMIKGWFIGNFTPTILKSSDFEVGVKEYKINDYENRHYHKEAVEITMVLDGMVQMNNTIYRSGDIIVIEKNESTDFKALTAARTLVIKTPSLPEDKYIGDSIDATNITQG